MKKPQQQPHQLGLLGLSGGYPTPASTPPSRPIRPPRPPGPPPNGLPPLPPRPTPAQASISIRVVCASIGHPDLGTLELPADFSPAEFSLRVSQAWNRMSGAPFQCNGHWTVIVPSLGMPCACTLENPLERARLALEAPAVGGLSHG